MKKTVKFTIRVNKRSPKYPTFGVRKTSSGTRLDGPYFSVSTFGPPHNPTIRERGGLRFIYENNRKAKTTITTQQVRNH